METIEKIAHTASYRVHANQNFCHTNQYLLQANQLFAQGNHKLSGFNRSLVQTNRKLVQANQKLVHANHHLFIYLILFTLKIIIMSKIDYIPRSHDEFHRWQEVFISRLQEKLGSFKLVAENVKALLAAQSKYELAYSRAANTEGG